MTTNATGDDDNNVDGDGATGNEVDDDGDGQRATTMTTTTMAMTTNDSDGDSTMESGATGHDKTMMVTGDNRNSTSPRRSVMSFFSRRMAM